AERTAELQQARDELEQRVIERTAELRQANEDVKNFAYIVSHDLRAPLVNIKGFAAELRESLSIITDMMHDILPSLDDSQQQLLTMTIDEDVPEALDFIDSSVERMDYFINAVLQLSRLGRQAMTIEHI
ncbi:MAG: sensor histidine kinase, partial [Phototrophicales bacterium]